MSDNFKKTLPKIIFFVIISLILVIILISSNDINQIFEVLSKVSWFWLSMALIILILYIFINPLTLCILGRNSQNPIKFGDSLMIGTIEYFFNGITPFSSGGQPFQVYAYNKIGIKPHQSTGILLINFVAAQMVIVILCLLSLFFYEDLTKGSTGLQALIIVGLTINILILVFFSALGLSKTVRNVLLSFLNWLFNLKIFKGKLAKYVSSFENYCQGAQETFKNLLNNKSRFILCLFTKLVAHVLFYMIPFFILKALHLDIGFDKLVLITAMTTFAVAMTCFIPTPGSAGGIEFAFKSLFLTVIPSATSTVAVSGMLLWRFLTYYLLMLISFVVYIVFERKTKFNYKKGIVSVEN